MTRTNTLLLSIHPDMAEKIYAGDKVFEFRKHTLSRPVKTILFYETYPRCRVTGCADLKKILQADKEVLWDVVSKKAGITKEQYDTYYKRFQKATAFHLENARVFRKPVYLNELNLKRAPQSMQYVEWKGEEDG